MDGGDLSDLTTGAAFVVGWLLGGAYTLATLRLTARLLSDYRTGSRVDGSQVDDQGGTCRSVGSTSEQGSAADNGQNRGT